MWTWFDCETGDDECVGSKAYKEEEEDKENEEDECDLKWIQQMICVKCEWINRIQLQSKWIQNSDNQL